MTGKPSVPIAIDPCTPTEFAGSSTVVIVLAPVQAASTHFATLSVLTDTSR
jgi:hypothetical protein